MNYKVKSNTTCSSKLQGQSKTRKLPYSHTMLLCSPKSEPQQTRKQLT